MIFCKGKWISNILSLTWLVRGFMGLLRSQGFCRGSVFAHMLRWYAPGAWKYATFTQHACRDIFLVHGCLDVHAKPLLQVCLCLNVLSRESGQGRRKEEEKKGSERGKARVGSRLNTVRHRWLLFRIPGSWSHAALSLYLTDPVGYELIKRNTSLDIVTLLSDYLLQPLSTEIGFLQQ